MPFSEETKSKWLKVKEQKHRAAKRAESTLVGIKILILFLACTLIYIAVR
jgi:hypothetical protein